MSDYKRITLHPIKKDGTLDVNTNLYPKTLKNAIVDESGNPVDIATSDDLDNYYNKDQTYSSDEIDEKIDSVDNIVITSSPDKYLNEGGLNKLVRSRGRSKAGYDVNSSYLIDKINHENTLVEAYADTEDYENGEDIQEDIYLFNQLFGNKFDELFGDIWFRNNLSFNYIINYDHNGEKTYGVRLGADDFSDYGCFNLRDCTPNKIIRVIAGKYFEYDENGNKVFDDHCVFYSDCFAENPDINYREITEERQVFELKIAANGNIYFDSDGDDLDFGPTRFILYGFECGEPESIEYKKRKIAFEDEVVKSLPVFYQSQTMRDVYNFYLAHPQEYGENETMGFAILPDDDYYNKTFVCIVNFNYGTPGEFWLGCNNGYTRFEFRGFIEHLDNSLQEILDNSSSDIYAMASQVKTWYGTQDQYDALPTKDNDTTYYIYED